MPAHVLAAPDKFKGTATATEIARAIGHACWERGLDCTELPLADGGDGLLDVFGGANRETTVTGPLGDPVRAGWRLDRGTAVIEMAQASGLAVVGGADRNDALDATTFGTGELIERALDATARRILVGLGGSATTDGGFGCIRAINGIARLRAVDLVVACDVTTTFLDAAEVFGPQKGASAAQVRLLTGRLERLAQMFLDEYGVDVTEIPGGGAAGGLGGALAALGGTLLPGFEIVADELGLDEQIERADYVITGEGRLDATSLAGKVVGGVIEAARAHRRRVGLVVGSVDPSFTVPDGVDVVALTDVVTASDAFGEPIRSAEIAAGLLLARAGV